VLRAVETGCRGGQGSPRAIVPSGKDRTIADNDSSPETNRFWQNVARREDLQGYA
jgi:hypothetical protein